MQARFISQTKLLRIASELLAAGTRVVAPAKSGRVPYEHFDFQLIAKTEEIVLDGPLPLRSIKRFFLPQTEVLMRWKQKKGDVELGEVATQFPRTVILGARPCDAAAPAIVDRVMDWDYRDELYFGRREATTVVGMACGGGDRECFCTGVGLGPAVTRGSDIFLTPIEGGYHTEIVTAKGEALVSEHAACFDDGVQSEAARRFGDEATKRVNATVKADATATGAPVKEWLEAHFEHPLWAEIAARCHGCGACASVCPTCHCFDIIDELRGVDHGERRRNWDTCQTARFTLHGSGHNPRSNQNARFRQRVTHKFAIYPSKFGEALCTGCGRCSRACPGGMDLPEILGAIDRLAAADSGGGTT